MITVRSLHPNDCAHILRINASAGATVFRLDLAELVRLMDISALHLVAVNPDGAIAGYALAFFRDHAYDGQEFLAFRSSIAAPFVYVDQIVIARQDRGAGVGSMLYREVAAVARRLGSTSLCCEVNISPPNPTSLAFHRHIGFVPIGELHTRDGRTVALLRRDI